MNRKISNCYGSPDLFLSENIEHMRRAKLACQGCPIKVDCVDEALQQELTYGIRGGHNFNDGFIMIGKKEPGAVPKNKEKKLAKRLLDFPVPPELSHLIRHHGHRKPKSDLAILQSAMNYSMN